jgi:hypothetical protein
VLGTLGMEHIRVTVSAKERWMDLSGEPSWSHESIQAHSELWP